MTSLLGRLAPGSGAKINLIADLLLLLVSIAAATFLSLDPDVPMSGWLAPGFGSAACLIWVVASTALRHYDPWADREPLDDAALVSVLVMAVTTLLAFCQILVSDPAGLPRVGHFLLVFWPLVLSLRLIVMRPLFVQAAPMDEVLIVGTGALGRLTGEDLQRRNKARRNVAGYLRFPSDGAAVIRNGKVLGTSEELESVLKLHAVSEVYIAGNPLKNNEAMQAVIKVCEKFGVPFALPAYSFRFDRARAANQSAISDGYLHYLSVDSKPYQMAFKRMFDIVASAAALWMLVPLFAVVAAIIKLTSKGPIFFKQVRVGLHGRTFHMLKFRSMVVDAEQLKARLEQQNEATGPVFKMKNDPRVTGIGRFIRKYSIDELPQLINVLRGDMSVVGPRPPIPSEVAKYEAWQRRRLSVRPGLTCIWQVSGRSQISFEQWMYLDMQYIDHWSLSGDFELILKTVPVVLTGRGAS